MLTFPNAKINLGLNIVDKRLDGFHNIETVFYPINIKDALEFVVSDSSKTEMTMSNIKVDGDINSNLVMKAYMLLKKDFELPNLSIHLQKNIPFGAGLGGGSSDAAFMLVMLNDFFQLGLTERILEDYAVQLGSDCPFFIKNRPVFASGRGELFDEVTVNLKGKYLVLVKPDIHVSTKDAYANCIPQKPSKCVKDIVSRPLEEWKELLNNDFEKSVFGQHSAIAEIKDKLYQNGAVYASMSGSGASVFGIFNEEPLLENKFLGFYFWKGMLD